MKKVVVVSVMALGAFMGHVFASGNISVISADMSKKVGKWGKKALQKLDVRKKINEKISQRDCEKTYLKADLTNLTIDSFTDAYKKCGKYFDVWTHVLKAAAVETAGKSSLLESYFRSKAISQSIARLSAWKIQGADAVDEAAPGFQELFSDRTCRIPEIAAIGLKAITKTSSKTAETGTVVLQTPIEVELIQRASLAEEKDKIAPAPDILIKRLSKDIYGPCKQGIEDAGLDKFGNAWRAAMARIPPPRQLNVPNVVPSPQSNVPRPPPAKKITPNTQSNTNG